MRIKGWQYVDNVRTNEAAGVSFQKVAKAAVGINLFNPDTKQTCDLSWTLYLQYENGTLLELASGSIILAPLEQAGWWQKLQWQTIPSCLQGCFLLKTENTYGINHYRVIMAILIANVDDNGIINMLDLYTCAVKFGTVCTNT